MRKSSRFWWLHGAILVSAVIGCKNCNSGGCGGGPAVGGASYGAPVGGTSYGTPISGGPTVSGGPTTYSSTYPGSGGVSSGTSGMSGGIPGGSFSSSANGMQMPATSSSLGSRGF